MLWRFRGDLSVYGMFASGVWPFPRRHGGITADGYYAYTIVKDATNARHNLHGMRRNIQRS